MQIHLYSIDFKMPQVSALDEILYLRFTDWKTQTYWILNSKWLAFLSSSTGIKRHKRHPSHHPHHPPPWRLRVSLPLTDKDHPPPPIFRRAIQSRQAPDWCLSTQLNTGLALVQGGTKENVGWGGNLMPWFKIYFAPFCFGIESL